MRYHDLKIRDAKRLAAIAAAGAAIFLFGLWFRSDVEPLVNRLPLSSDEPFVPLMGALATLVLLCAGVAFWYLRTSPAQNADYLNRKKQRGRDIPEQFDWALLDEGHPDFHVSTWQYLRSGRGKRR